MYRLIAKDSGAVHVRDGYHLCPSTTRTEFEMSTTGAALEPWQPRPGMAWYRVRGGLTDGTPTIVNPVFEGPRLQTIAVVLCLEGDADTWADWSEEQEQIRKAHHDALLADDLDPFHCAYRRLDPLVEPFWEGYVRPEYTYSWGTVASVFEPRASESLITVVYGRESLLSRIGEWLRSR